MLRSVRDGEPFVVEAEQESSDEAGAWWSADLHVHNPLTSYRFLLTDGRSRFRWLNASGVHDARRHRRVGLPGQHRAPAAGLGGGPGRLPGIPRPLRAHRDTERRCPRGRTRREWDDPVVHRGPDVPSQLYGGTLDGITRRLGHLTRPRRHAALPDPGLRGAVQPPLRRRLVRARRPAARRRRGAQPAAGRRARGRHPRRGRPDHQPHRRLSTTGSSGRAPTRPATSAASTGSATTTPTSRGSTSPRCPSSTTPTSSWPGASTTAPTRWWPGGCARDSTAGASTSPT